jgi:hypothetical protein
MSRADCSMLTGHRGERRAHPVGEPGTALTAEEGAVDLEARRSGGAIVLTN